MATKREVLACLEQSQLQRDFRRPANARAVPGLAPALHAYQAAALEWMLQREQRRDSLPAAEALLGGTISDVRGGVLADEMGLGKTVTVAALVLAAPADDATPQAETTRVALRLGGARLPATTLMEKPLPDPPKGERRGGVRAVCVCGDAVSDGVVCAFCGAVAHRACAAAASCACLGSRGAPSENGLVKSRATLVVCPAAIAGQWKGELARHAPSLMVAEYPGVQALQKSARAARRAVDNPRTRNYGRALQSLGDCLRRLDGSALRPADVVLTTFGALRSDRYYQPQQAYAARVPPSPLLTTDWRRVCLDEAQVVRGGATAAATVARKLSGCRRWCVSGTPVAAGGLEDVRALYEFLGSPSGYSSRQWSEAVGSEGGATKLANLFRETAWRATKSRVDHAIPPQKAVLRHLTFDAVERFVYDRLDEACARDLAALTGDAVNEACSLQGGGVSRLRQACVHPSLAMPRRKRRKRKRGIVEEPKAVATMEETLWRLVEDAQLKAEESQRERLYHLFARAGVARCRADLVEGFAALGYDEDAPGVVAALARTTKDHLRDARTLYETALQAIEDGRDAATGLRVPRDVESVKTNERLSLGRARRVVRVAIKASTSIDVRLESKNPRGGFDEVARGTTAPDAWTTIDVTKPHEAKAEEWRLASKHDGTVEARFYESRVDSDWALELHCLHNLAATKELLGDDGSDEKEGAQRIRARQGAARFDRVSGAVQQLEAFARGRGAVLEQGASGNAWWRRALQTDGAPEACEQVLAAPTTQQFNAAASRRGFEERCDSNVDAFARRVEAALRGVSAARRAALSAARDGARVAKGGGAELQREIQATGACRVCAEDWGAVGPVCPTCRRVDVITDAFAHLKSERQHLIEENAPVTRALCALAAHAPWRRLASTAEKNEAEALLNALGAATTGESRVETSTDAGCKHELLQARRAMTALVDALLKENEALAATRRVEVLRADADLSLLEEHEKNARCFPADLGARDLEAAAGEQDALLELKTRTKRLAFLESHAVESDVKSDDDEVCRICLERLDACGGYDTTTSLVSVLPCGHAFHDACLRKWAKSKCPSCRGNYGEADVRSAVRNSVTGTRAVEATKLDSFLEDAQQAVARGEQSVRGPASYAQQGPPGRRDAPSHCTRPQGGGCSERNRPPAERSAPRAPWGRD
jgi:hypothetical protein